MLADLFAFFRRAGAVARQPGERVEGRSKVVIATNHPISQNILRRKSPLFFTL
jgi:hypothetical protein